VRRLLAVLRLDDGHRAFSLHWSRWRRQRQAEARRCHYRRRGAREPDQLPL
jgi:hypothetical protein